MKRRENAVLRLSVPFPPQPFAKYSPRFSEIDVLLWEHLDELCASVVVSHVGGVVTGVCGGFADRGDMRGPDGAGVGGMRVVQGVE
ncbi:hypothetical protein [Geobacter sulfurreducens]|uniref:hypothetical protein n=1 Tax=Geobacter sulfurreducens TaxID=35554 RepID=UPI0020B892B7|nr:hypothetical protein [Geobacter sulfurreducens]UTG91941.1 hypothetical protein J8622_13010 [Geobacter sulfurreducens]